MTPFKRIKDIFIGRSRSLQDKTLFRNLSLVAFLAWVGFGADGLSSSCYGPAAAFEALRGHEHLALLVGAVTVATIFIISASYSQIIELFPSGGGGYLVASKLLSPGAGVVAGCALLIDYVLTITVSVASGAEAIFSLLPVEWQQYRLPFAVGILFILIILNLRGVKESLVPLVPIFLLFIFTHLFMILYGIFSHTADFPVVASNFRADASATVSSLGVWGGILLILHSYSMGAGTYTGIEAISNSVPMLREPRVQTAKATMIYMAISLATVVMGLMLLYLLYQTSLVPGKTMNAVLVEKVASAWNPAIAGPFIFLTLFSEAALLFVATQTGFLGGPKVLANMAQDRWFPTRFSVLSDRLVTQNGVLIMGLAAFAILMFSNGNVWLMLIIYTINVFITFVLSQLGMVRHWWNERQRKASWRRRMIVSGTGLALSTFILISVIITNTAGWVTLIVTGALIFLAWATRAHYRATAVLLKRLDTLVDAVNEEVKQMPQIPMATYDPKGKTAVVFVGGFNGMGLHTLMNVIRFFGGTFKNFVFIQVGIMDAGNFKGVEELEGLKAKTANDVNQYVQYMQRQGCHAEGLHSVGVDLIEEAEKLALEAAQKYPNTVFFGGQLVFPHDSFVNRLFHNFTVFSLQKHLYKHGLLFVILPIRV